MSGLSVDGGAAAFLQHEARPQAPISTAPFHQWSAPNGALWTQFYRQPTGYLLRFPALADFEVSGDGQEIEGWPAPGMSSATVQHLYLNQVLPLALSRQGKLVLHGSAVSVSDQALAFIGESGRGKSTLAASFATSGTRFLTDDGLQLEWIGQNLTVIPSHPSIRLWDDSREALLSDSAVFAPSLEFTSKARLLAGTDLAFCPERRNLARVYLLGIGAADTPTITLATPASALTELLRNSFLLDINAQDMLARHFDALTRIANLPIHYHLDFPRRYGDLDQVREAIIQHAARSTE